MNDAHTPASSSERAWSFRQQIENLPLSATQLLVLVICFFLNVIDGYDVLSMAFAAPALAEDWQLPADQLGIVFSAGVLGMTLGAMWLAPLTDRYGRRTVILCAVLAMGLSMLATAFVNALATMVLLRVLTGLTIGAMLASLTSLVSEFFPDGQRNMAVGIILAGYPLGATLGGFVAAWLTPHFGWQGVFYAGGGLTLLMVPAIYFGLPESVEFLLQRRPARALARINDVLKRLRLPQLQTLPPLGTGTVAAASVRSLLEIERRKDTLQLWTAFFLCFGTLYFLLSWIPKLLVDVGITMELAIYAGIAFNLGGAVGNIGIAWCAQRLGLQRSILLFHVLASACMLLFAWVPLGGAVMLVLTAVIGLFQQGGFVGFYMVAARLYPVEIRTTGIGWGIGLGRFGAVLAPYIAGLLIAAGWGVDLLFTLFALPLLVGGWIVFRMHQGQLKTA